MVSKQTLSDIMYMGVALLHARRSKAVRKKCGCVIVTPHQVMLGGWNGTPPGWDNNCEEEIDGKLITKSSVLHAEENAFLKAAREGVSCVGATIYTTLEPCLHCASKISAAGIYRVVYLDNYVSQSHGSGVESLIESGVEVKYFADYYDYPESLLGV